MTSSAEEACVRIYFRLPVLYFLLGAEHEVWGSTCQFKFQCNYDLRQTENEECIHYFKKCRLYAYVSFVVLQDKRQVFLEM